MLVGDSCWFGLGVEDVLTEAMERIEHRKKSRDDVSFMLGGWRRGLA
jgi:hypothetical protein